MITFLYFHRIAKDQRFERLPCLHKGTYADDCIVQRIMQVCTHESAYCRFYVILVCNYTPRKLCLWKGILFSRCPSVRPNERKSDRASVTFCFLNILKNHRWNFIKFCKHIHMYKANISKNNSGLGANTIGVTGQLRYLEFQGNGENTSSFPKFEIANYDVTRIHVHEQKCVHSNFRKIGIATKRVYACNPLCTTRTFYPQISWSVYGCG